MGIEPTWPAWKAGALPLSYTRIHTFPNQPTKKCRLYGGGRRIRTFERIRGQIYSLLPLTARPPLRSNAYSKIDHL